MHNAYQTKRPRRLHPPQNYKTTRIYKITKLIKPPENVLTAAEVEKITRASPLATPKKKYNKSLDSKTK